MIADNALKIGLTLFAFYLNIYSSLGFSTTPIDRSSSILSKTLKSTQIIDDLKELTTTIGGRPTGSLSMDKAVDWGLKKFKEAELEQVHSENYRASLNWLPKLEHAYFSFNVGQADSTVERLLIASMPFSPSTILSGSEAEVYYIGTGNTAAFHAVGKKGKGKWLLVLRPLTLTIEDLLKEYSDKPAIIAQAKKIHAKGVLWISSRPGQLLYRHNLTFNGTMGSMPAAVIERQGGERIIKLIESGHVVKVMLNIQNVIQKNKINHNVVAEIRGWEKPNEVVLLGAHLDSWDLGQGALDNGCNVTLVIDVARQLMKLAKKGQRPRRTLRFVLYSGEELGLYGSRFDVFNHRQQLDKIKTVIIYDLGSGRTTGFSLGGRADMSDTVTRALSSIQKLGPFTQTLDASMDTDNFDYFLSGIPTLVANQESKPYLADYHATSDTFDKVDLNELKRNTAIAAVVLWNLANDEKLPSTRLNRKEVMSLVQSSGLAVEMKGNDIWNDFILGRRG